MRLSKPCLLCTIIFKDFVHHSFGDPFEVLHIYQYSFERTVVSNADNNMESTPD